ITKLQLTVNGQPRPLDSQGQASVPADAPGKADVEVTATDADGLVGFASAVLKVRDPADQSAPVVAFDPLLNGSRLSAVTPIVATVTDTNLDSWVLEEAPFGHGSFVPIAGAVPFGFGQTAPVSGPLAVFDPSALANGFYRLRLTARDISGRTSSTEVV